MELQDHYSKQGQKHDSSSMPKGNRKARNTNPNHGTVCRSCGRANTDTPGKPNEDTRARAHEALRAYRKQHCCWRSHVAPVTGPGTPFNGCERWFVISDRKTRFCDSGSGGPRFAA